METVSLIDILRDEQPIGRVLREKIANEIEKLQQENTILKMELINLRLNEIRAENSGMKGHD